MVLRKARKSKTVGKKYLWIVVWFCFLVLIATLTVMLWTIINKSEGQTPASEESAYEGSEITEVEPVEEPEVILPAKIDLQSVVDNWTSTVGSGNRSVLIYDLERNEVAGAYNTNEKYSTASLYKLFVVYEGYRRLQTGEWKGEDKAGATGYTITKCLDLAIRESYSPCAEALWGMIGHDELDRIIMDDFKITDSDISSLISTPEDIAKIIEIFYRHSDITDEQLVSQMKDSFLNQPVTTYDWRQGLPSGFTKANVYNKVGWEYNGRSWNIYHDAAIVEFPDDNRHFVVVVMTNQVPYQKIRNLGSMIETAYLEAVNNPDQ